MLNKTTKALITVSLSASLLVGCSDKEEKVTTTSNTQEKSSQTKPKDQQPPQQKSVLKETENITNLGGEPIPELSLEEGKNSARDNVTSVKNGYVYHMFAVGGAHGNPAKIYVSIADVKKNKWIVKNKMIHQFTVSTGSDGEIVETHGTAFSSRKKTGENKVVFLNEKGELKEVEGKSFIRTSKGDAAYTSTDTSLKLTFENGKTQEIPMNQELQFSQLGDYIDLDNEIAIKTGRGDFEIFDLKKGKQIFDDQGQKLKVSQTGDYTMFKDHIISVSKDTNSDKFSYLDTKLKDKNLSVDSFITVKGTGTFYPSKDKLVQIRHIEYEGKKAIQYIEYKESK